MTELTEREQKIVLIKYIVHGNSPFSKIDLTKRIQMLQASMRFMGLDYDEREMLAIGEECLAFQHKVNETNMNFLKKHPEEVKIAARDIKHGNDPAVIINKMDDVDITKALDNLEDY